MTRIREVIGWWLMRFYRIPPLYRLGSRIYNYGWAEMLTRVPRPRRK